jgi:endonuclease/exonuclease/phosphatase family metal-dependent hydrolase
MDAIRAVTLNLWNDRADPERRLEVVAEDLRALEPDVVALQEVREGPSWRRPHPRPRPEHAGGLRPVDAQSTGGPCGNAVLSRYPSSRRAEPHAAQQPGGSALCAGRDGPQPAGDVRVVSTHLTWEPRAALRREQQVLALDEICQGPEQAHVLLCGDFNTSPAAAAIRFLTGCDSLHGRGTFYRDAWARRHPSSTEGFTYSSENPRAVRWIEQNRRIDYCSCAARCSRTASTRSWSPASSSTAPPRTGPGPPTTSACWRSCA